MCAVKIVRGTLTRKWKSRTTYFYLIANGEELIFSAFIYMLLSILIFHRVFNGLSTPEPEQLDFTI